MKILIYSDCPLFGGSEHLIINMLKDKELKHDIKYSFAYRYHTLYHRKVSELLININDINLFPIKLLSNYEISYKLINVIKHRFFYRLIFAPFYFLEKLGVYDIVNRLILTRFLKLHDFDIVHINNGGYPGARSCLLLAGICKCQNIKVILQVNNIAKKSKDSTIDKIVRNSTDLFITGSKIARDSLSNVLDIPTSKILAIPHFVEKIEAKKSREDICKALSISETSIIIVEVALLQERKGQVELIKAVNLLSKQLNKKIELILIGDGENKKNIVNAIQDTGMNNNVHLLGYRNDYIDYVNAADIVTLPSLKDEDMPLILISALSLGKAIVSTKLAGIPEEIEDGVSGILIEPQSENFVLELSDALLTAYRDKEMLSENAIIRYNQIFSKEKFIKSYKYIYSNL